MQIMVIHKRQRGGFLHDDNSGKRIQINFAVL